MNSTKNRFHRHISGACLTLIVLILTVGCDPKKDFSSEISESGKYANLLEARSEFNTRLVPNSFKPDGPANMPPEGVFDLVRYKSTSGNLAAYITPDPGDGKKHAAVIWAHGGFGGIGSWLWEEAPTDNDQSVRAFLQAGIVTMCPSWRGENDNPGKFELFYGEVDDLLSALEYLKQLPYVDPDRIYLAGHSTGGTLALLASTATDEFRAIFSLGGAPDVHNVVSDGEGYGNTPFNHWAEEESFYRSAILFVDMIVTPTFYFEGEDSFYCPDALAMQSKSRKKGIPFKAFIIENETHFSILHSLNNMIAQKIQSDTGTNCNISISENDIRLH